MKMKIHQHYPSRRRRTAIAALALSIPIAALWTYLCWIDRPNTLLASLPLPPKLHSWHLGNSFARRFEDIKLAHLKGEFDAEWYFTRLGYGDAPETLTTSVDGYVGRLEVLVDKWFDGVPGKERMLESLNRVRQHQAPLDPEEKMREKIISTDRGGEYGGLPEFRRWQQVPWDMYVADDEGMEALFMKLTAGEGEGTRRMRGIWDSLPRQVLKSDFLRYLVMLQQGGLYTDSDTAPRAHPYHWGRGAIDRLPQSLTEYLEEDGEEGAELLRGDSIVDPEVSLVIGGEYDAKLRGELDQWYAYDPPDCARSYQFTQWTMMAKPFHPLFIDVVVSVLERVQDAIDAGQLGAGATGDAVALTGPGAFTDAVFRYLLAAYGVTPHDLYGREDASKFGDVIVLWADALRFPWWELESDGSFDEESMWSRPVSHIFRGSWKGQGWNRD